MRLLPFQRRWLRETWRPDTEISCLSLPRGGGKTTLAARIIADLLTPDHPRFDPTLETLGVSASLSQSRIMVQAVREHLRKTEDDYSWVDSSQRLAIRHKETGKLFRVLSSSGKRAMGLSRFDVVVMDEPGSLDPRNGTLLWRAVSESLGKLPGQRALCIGTRAPAEPDNWWPQMLERGSGPGIHVSVLAADTDAPWDAWLTVRRANPLLNASATLRRTVLRERDAARKDPALERSYRAFRLNQIVDVSASPLLAAADWLRVERRRVPPRSGRPIVGLDAGGARAWSAAAVLWPNGRIEGFALTGGVPNLRERERQDSQRRGLYSALRASGRLIVDEGRRVPRLDRLFDHLQAVGITPASVVCDRFRVGEVGDAIRGRWPLATRTTRWSESTEDVGALRTLAADGPLACEEASRPLLRVALSEAECEEDNSGNLRPRKRRGDRSRDDVAIALTLAAGVLQRHLRRPPQRFRLHAVG